METNNLPPDVQKDVDDLKVIIRAQLKYCQSDLYPNLCKYSETEEGRVAIEDKVIRMIIRRTGGMNVGEALYEIEREYSPDNPEVS